MTAVTAGRIRAWARIAGALTLAACAGNGPATSGPSEFRVVNGGTVELRAVVVRVSDADSIRAAVLAPGAATAYAPAAAVHESPFIRATVAGEDRFLQPVEGFDAFNPRRQPGRFTVSVAAGAGRHELAVTVRRD